MKTACLLLRNDKTKEIVILPQGTTNSELECYPNSTVYIDLLSNKQYSKLRKAGRLVFASFKNYEETFLNIWH